MLGVFIANMIHFQSPYLYMDPYTWFSSPGDAATFKGIDIFVEGSFYPIFAMLFGYGLNMQYEKTLANGSAFAPMMARRLAILLGIGVIHALFVWSGDVLFTYATMGFIMIAFVRIPKKWLLPIAAVLYIIPNALLYAVTRFLETASPNSVLAGYANIQKIELAISAYGLGSYGEIFSFRFFEWLTVGLLGMFGGLVLILPLLMIGAGLSKWQVFERAGEMKGRIAVMTVRGIGGRNLAESYTVYGGADVGCSNAAISIWWAYLGCWAMSVYYCCSVKFHCSARYSDRFLKQAECR